MFERIIPAKTSRNTLLCADAGTAVQWWLQVFPEQAVTSRLCAKVQDWVFTDHGIPQFWNQLWGYGDFLPVFDTDHSPFWPEGREQMLGIWKYV